MSATEIRDNLAHEGNGETLLFVDDEVKQLRLMQQFLEETGYRVLTAADGAEAVDLFIRHKDEIALVILDIGLPTMNGSEALRAMKKAAPHVKAIVATAYLPPQAAASEWRAVIFKPYGLDDILAQISRILRQP
jgi:two-component system cell cycle sensor histidine kinase/response regulator CckA